MFAQQCNVCGIYLTDNNAAAVMNVIWSKVCWRYTEQKGASNNSFDWLSYYVIWLFCNMKRERERERESQVWCYYQKREE